MTDRDISEDETQQMKEAKALAIDFVNLLHAIGKTGYRDGLSSRELSMARTKIDEAVMWTVKHFTK